MVARVPFIDPIIDYNLNSTILSTLYYNCKSIISAFLHNFNIKSIWHLPCSGSDIINLNKTIHLTSLRTINISLRPMNLATILHISMRWYDEPNKMPKRKK